MDKLYMVNYRFIVFLRVIAWQADMQGSCAGVENKVAISAALSMLRMLIEMQRRTKGCRFRQASPTACRGGLWFKSYERQKLGIRLFHGEVNLF